MQHTAVQVEKAAQVEHAFYGCRQGTRSDQPSSSMSGQATHAAALCASLCALQDPAEIKRCCPRVLPTRTHTCKPCSRQHHAAAHHRQAARLARTCCPCLPKHRAHAEAQRCMIVISRQRVCYDTTLNPPAGSVPATPPMLLLQVLG